MSCISWLEDAEICENMIPFFKTMTKSPHLCTWVCYTHTLAQVWSLGGWPWDEGLRSQRFWGSALRINVCRGVRREDWSKMRPLQTPALDLAWSCIVVPHRVKGAEPLFPSTHQSLPGCSWERGVPLGKEALCSWGNHQEGLCGEQQLGWWMGGSGHPQRSLQSCLRFTTLCSSDMFWEQFLRDSAGPLPEGT